MKDSRLGFVSFEREGDRFSAYISLAHALNMSQDLERVMRSASVIYRRFIIRTRAQLRLLAGERRKGHVRTLTVWRIGNSIFTLNKDLAAQSVRVSGLYEHLERDLAVKRKWLEKVIILRRYLPDESVIPADMKWSDCEKGTRRIAEMLSAGRWINREE